MRTRECLNVLRVGVIELAPRPTLYLVYDGLGGLSGRPMLRDIWEELARKGPTVLKPFLDALQRAGSGHVFVYFHDYVSYGIGGGDATAEFFFGTRRIYWVDAFHPFKVWDSPGLALSAMEPIPATPRPTTGLTVVEDYLPLEQVQH
jgi:hypothetical protein